jgi:ABC-type branched-subunit amino acid transport system ATPase component
MALVVVEGISRAFAGVQALDDVSFEVNEANIVGLIGPNGAGKTTLFNIIAGTIRPDRGSIVFDGNNITGWPSHRIAHKGIGRTFQLMKPFSALSVLDNVTIAALQRQSSRVQANQAARKVIERVGLDEWANKPASVLSTAGRKRLELAKALALRPRLLLLDEVLAGITPSERAVLIDLIKEILTEGVTMLLVEHVMSAVMALSDHILVLHYGRLLASGTPQEITRDQRVIDAYLGEDYLGGEEEEEHADT